MNFLERIKLAWATFRAVGGIDLPDAGRSSEETIAGSMGAYLGAYGSLSPIINFEMLKTLKCFWLYNPDLSQYVANIVNLGNPGHQLSIDAASDSVAERAIERLNESASRIYRHGMGVDGLLNQYLTSVAWSGAVSSEDVVDFAGRRVEKVVLVPVEQIRFRYNKDTDDYEAFQKATTFNRERDRTAFGLIRLNPETYKYYALSTIENSPYAKPPATAAVDAILKGQVPIMENIQFMAQKIGLLGLITAAVQPPTRKPSETEDEYHSKATAYLQRVTAALQGQFSKGLIVAFKDQKFEHTSVTEGASGVYDLNRMSEEQVFSGMAAMPGFHGRTDSTTETFADVVYYLLTAQVGNMQRIAKRRQERTYRLDLRLGGIDVNDVSLAFNKAHSRNGKEEADTDEVRFRVALAKVEKGLITPDAGAQELGYESWEDTEMIGEQGGVVPAAASQRRSFGKKHNNSKTVKLVFDKASQNYRHVPECIEVWSGEDETAAGKSVVPFIKKKAQQA
jgi:hypothetical protein